jgi:glycosyltransferase involved in cell wall biosynthesis
VATSQFVKDYSVKRLGVPAERCAVIPCGIDVARFAGGGTLEDRLRVRQQFGLTAEHFVYLNAAAINHQKNHLSLLRAFEPVARECERAHLVVIGPVYERDLYRDVQQFVERSGLSSRVTFVGAVADPHGYYLMADAYVHSAFFEGGPLTVLEALAANLPVVTVATGLAVHFQECRGVHVVPAHFDVAAYDGHITAMKSSPNTERAMAEAMCELYREPVRPDLSPEEIQSFDRSNAYRTYVEMVRGLMAGQAPTLEMIESRSWARKISGAV